MVTNTNPDCAGKGIASTMLSKLADEARKREVQHIWLLASSLGKPVCERFGFIGTGRYLELNPGP